MKHDLANGNLFYSSPKPTIFSNLDKISKEITLSSEFDSYQTISFCDNFTQLVQTFFDHFDPVDGFSTGGVMFQPCEVAKVTTELAELIGVRSEDASLTKNQTSFVLARQWKRMTKMVSEQNCIYIA